MSVSLSETEADLEGPTFLVVLDEVALAELSGCSVDEVCPLLVQQPVALQVLRVHSVQLRGSQHPDVEVGVA